MCPLVLYREWKGECRLVLYRVGVSTVTIQGGVKGMSSCPLCNVVLYRQGVVKGCVM